jgi:hypothetical protein
MYELSAEMTAKFAFPNVNDRLAFGLVELPNRPRRIFQAWARERHAAPGAAVQLHEPRSAVVVTRNSTMNMPAGPRRQHSLGARRQFRIDMHGHARARAGHGSNLGRRFPHMQPAARVSRPAPIATGPAGFNTTRSPVDSSSARGGARTGEAKHDPAAW